MMVKTFLFRSVMGIFFGAFLTVLATICFVYVGQQSMLDGEVYVKNALGTLFCGWFFTVSPLYFEVKSLKLYQQTLLHFCTVALLYFLLAFGIGWIPVQLNSILFFIALFLVFYAVIWSAFYLYFRHVANSLNGELKNL